MIGILILELARYRIQSAIDEIHRLQQGEFPYDEPKVALQKLAEIFEKQIYLLAECNPQGNKAFIQRVCSNSLEKVAITLPILGFILRSTNVRNAFEVYGPLRRLIRQILTPYSPSQHPQLLLSSEWDYSPYTYPSGVISDLPEFICIGLPAQEASNPLLLPIAGHEIGHSLWSCRRHDETYGPEIERRVSDLFTQRKSEFKKAFPNEAEQDPGTSVLAIESRARAKLWVIDQAEESYCDFVAARIFGISYLHAFRYLIGPSLPGPRDIGYPNIIQRARQVSDAASQYEIDLAIFQEPYEEGFQDQPYPALLSDSDKFILSVVDEVHKTIVAHLITQAHEDIERTGVLVPSNATAKSVCKKIIQLIPADNCSSLADILNGGWLAFNETDRWGRMPEIDKCKDIILFDLILKSIEVFEIERIIEDEKTKLNNNTTQ